MLLRAFKLPGPEGALVASPRVPPTRSQAEDQVRILITDERRRREDLEFLPVPREKTQDDRLFGGFAQVPHDRREWEVREGDVVMMNQNTGAQEGVDALRDIERFLLRMGCIDE